MSTTDYPIFEMHTDEHGNPSVRISDKVALLTQEQSKRVLERFKSLEAENAKLRALLSSYWKAVHYPCTPTVPKDYLSEMRKLGIEVD